MTQTQNTSAASTANVMPAPLPIPEPSKPAPQVRVSVSIADFRACPSQSRWKTSSHYLRETARCIQAQNVDNPIEAKRTALIEDIFIKSWSYAILNKGFFWLSVALAVLVLMWPSLVAIFKTADAGTEAKAQTGAEAAGDGDAPVPAAKSASFLVKAVNAASMQTTITALAALSFAFYSHYKERQGVSENLMRTILYTTDFSDSAVSGYIKQIAAMDKGFGFSQALGQPVNREEGPDFP